jgi:DNA end-binding protein Ku
MARALWSGTISFGLVSIPIELYPCTQDKDVHFHLVTPDGKSRVKRQLVVEGTDRTIDFGDTVRGYEIAPGQYVVVTPEELQELQPESGSTVDLDHFVDRAEVDPVFFERSYYAVPKKGSDKAYWLLHRALRESGKVGIGEFIMREKEHVAAIRAGEEVIVLDTLYFEDEIRKPEDVGAPAPPSAARVGGKELSVAVELIEKLTDKFRPGQYRDDYRREVLEMIKKKAKGRKKVEPMKDREPRRSAQVIDLMERLRASLKSGSRPAKKTAPKRGASKDAKRRKSA